MHTHTITPCVHTPVSYFIHAHEQLEKGVGRKQVVRIFMQKAMRVAAMGRG